MKTVPNRLHAHLAACAVVTAAAVSGGADAAIVYSGIQNIAIPANLDGVYLNLITGLSGSSAGAVAGWHVNPYSATALRFGTNFPEPDVYFVGTGADANGGPAVNLAVGSVIGNPVASTMSASYVWSYSTAAAVFGASAGQWQLNADNYLGIRSFEADGSVLKAWMRIAVGATVTSRTIVDWAYEIDGRGLEVGAIPAPGAIALLGLAGVLGRRRR
jgi:hypothetical protein